MAMSIAPVLEAVALAAVVRLKWPEYDPEYTKVVTVNKRELGIPIMDMFDPQPVPEHVGWKNVPGVKAFAWRLLGRLFHKSLWLNRGREPLFEMVPSPFYYIALEPKPVGAFPIKLDYARYNERWGVLAVKLPDEVKEQLL
jgi:hypothetical protein